MRRRSVIGLLVLVLLGVGGFAWRQQPLAQVATGYMARVACACHFIAHRPIEACYADAEPGMELVRLSVETGPRRVTASVPLLAQARASHTPGLGCVLEPLR
jgi:tetrahydromethanopterin S-methyltransferase subunit C